MPRTLFKMQFAFPRYLSGIQSHSMRFYHCKNTASFREEQLDYEQRTLSRKIEFKGAGLHSGQICNLVIKPASSDTGIVFRGISCNKELGASWERVIDTRWSTILGFEPLSKMQMVSSKIGSMLSQFAPNLGRMLSCQTFATVEHLLAAISGANIDNVVIELSGNEVPIMDGSALPFSIELQDPSAVVTIPGSKVKACRILRRVEVQESDGRMVSIEPLTADDTDVGHDLHISVDVDFGERIQDGAGGRQRAEFWRKDFLTEAAAARTFCFYEDLKLLRSMGLTAGGSLENAIVFASGRALNPGGLRCPNEIARHKALDALGDLRLGGRLLGRYRGIKPGHSLNHRLLQKLFTSAAPTI